MSEQELVGLANRENGLTRLALAPTYGERLRPAEPHSPRLVNSYCVGYWPAALSLPSIGLSLSSILLQRTMSP
jgi:hypothetical protein